MFSLPITSASVPTPSPIPATPEEQHHQKYDDKQCCRVHFAFAFLSHHHVLMVCHIAGEGAGRDAVQLQLMALSPTPGLSKERSTTYAVPETR